MSPPQKQLGTISLRSNGAGGRMATDRSQSQSALHQAAQIQTMLTELIDEARAGVLRVDDLRARALFEVTAEVLLGLRNAYQDFEQASDTAWKKVS